MIYFLRIKRGLGDGGEGKKCRGVVKKSAADSLKCPRQFCKRKDSLFSGGSLIQRRW